MIKHRDEWAGPIDIATFAPLSIKSGGDFTDILEQESPDLWTSNRAAKGGQAHMLKVVERAVAIAEENKARKRASDNHEGAKARRREGQDESSRAESPEPKAQSRYNSFRASTLHTAYARRQRSCRAISRSQKSASMISQPSGTSPMGSIALCSAS